MSIEKTDKYFEDLFKFKDSIEILDDVYNKLNELSKSFSMKEENKQKIEVSLYEVYKRLSTFYFYRDGYMATKDILKENKLTTAKDIQNIFKNTKDPLYNHILASYLKSKIKPDTKEYESLFEVDPYQMNKIEKILGSYSIMRNSPEIVASVINLDIDNAYIDVLLQLNQQIDGFDQVELTSIDGKKYNTSNDNLLCIKKINKDSIDLVSIDSVYDGKKFTGKEYNNVPIKQVLEVLLENELKDEDLNNNITHINILDLKTNNIEKILVLENVLNTLENSEQNIER